MIKVIVKTITIWVMLVSTANAGLFSYSGSSDGSVAVAVEVEGSGIHNLVVSVNFLRKPFDKREYTSDGYEELLSRLGVEWKGATTDAVLKNNKFKVTELSKIRASISEAIESLITSAKSKHGVPANIEVTYSISSLYLVKPDAP